MYQHFRNNGRTLHHASQRSDISGQYSQSACLCIRIVNRSDNLRIFIHSKLNILTNRLACYCHAICMQKSDIGKFLHYCINTAGFIQIFHIGRTCRCKMAKVRCFLTDLICKGDVKVKANLMSDCRKVKHTVCGTAKRHIHRQGIQDRILCHDIARSDVFSEYLHNRITGMLCKLQSLRVYSRNGAVSAKSHTKCLCQTVHGIRCIHTGAGSAGRTYIVLKLAHILFCHLACCISADSLEHRRKASLLSSYMTCQHRTA